MKILGTGATLFADGGEGKRSRGLVTDDADRKTHFSGAALEG